MSGGSRLSTFRLKNLTMRIKLIVKVNPPGLSTMLTSAGLSMAARRRLHTALSGRRW